MDTGRKINVQKGIILIILCFLYAFQAVPNLSTFRTDGKTKAAYSANVHDRIGRQGVEGAGIYVSAVN